MQSISQYLCHEKVSPVVLNTEDQLLTFITPFGQLKCLRAPYGISSISEHHDCCMTETFTGLTGFHHIVNDIVIYDSDALTHTEHVRIFLKCCADKNIALSLTKCKFHQTKVTLAGFMLSADGYQVNHKIRCHLSILDSNWSHSPAFIL